MPQNLVPQFPLDAVITRHNGVGAPVSTFGSPCQVRYAQQTFVVVPQASYYEYRPVVSIYFPSGTDVRSHIQGPWPDSVEAPAGSGVVYMVMGLVDVAKGFPNEFRVALAEMISSPAPLP